MLTLGIDPGTATTGYGLVELSGNRLNVKAYGHIKTFPTEKNQIRLKEIYQSLKKIIEQYRPDYLAIEEIFFNTNIKTAIKVAQAKGVIMLCAANLNLEITEYTPPQIKLAVTGYGKADKIQIQTMVKTLLNLEKIPRPDDTADALAVAICHLHHLRI